MIIHSDNQPRGMCKLGRVQELLTGPDGEPRAAVLQVASLGRNAKCLQHSLQRLYCLAMSSLGDHTDVANNCNSHWTPDIERDGVQLPQDEKIQPDNQVQRFGGQQP